MRLVRAAIIDEDKELLSGEWMQRSERVSRSGPPLETTRRKAFETQPITLPIIDQEFNRCPGSVPENEEGAGERIFFKVRFTESHQRIDALSKIDWLIGEQNLHVWCELDHVVSRA